MWWWWWVGMGSLQRCNWNGLWISLLVYMRECVRACVYNTNMNECTARRIYSLCVLCCGTLFIICCCSAHKSTQKQNYIMQFYFYFVWWLYLLGYIFFFLHDVVKWVKSMRCQQKHDDERVRGMKGESGAWFYLNFNIYNKQVLAAAARQRHAYDERVRNSQLDA